MKYMYITNDPEVAKIAEQHSVDRIWIDLEYLGKDDRQKGIDSVKSKHNMSDISAIKQVLTMADLVVRVNPLNEGSEAEISEAIERGADYIMLPMARSINEIDDFVNIVSKKTKTIILVETIAAANIIDQIAQHPKVDEIHVGLNDLHLEYKLKFMFELLINGVIEKIVDKLRACKKPYGIGGVGALNSGVLPGRYIISEYFRLNCHNVILSRSFCNTTADYKIAQVEEMFKKGMSELRAFEEELAYKDERYFTENRNTIRTVIENYKKTYNYGHN